MLPNVQQITRLDNQQFGVAKYGTLILQAKWLPIHQYATNVEMEITLKRCHTCFIEILSVFIWLITDDPEQFYMYFLNTRV